MERLNSQNHETTQIISLAPAAQCRQRPVKTQNSQGRNEFTDKLIKDLTDRLKAGWNPLDDIEEDPQLYLTSLLQYLCFLRTGDELLKLKIGQINFTKRTIFIPKDIT